jgi:hypothetical protein
MTLLVESQSLVELMGTPFEVLEKGPHSEGHQYSPLPEPNQVVLYSERPSPEQVLEMHEPEAATMPLEFHEEMPAIEIELSDLPGVDELDEEKEKALEVSDDTIASNDTLQVDTGEAKEKKSKKDPKWDWEGRLKEGGSHGFVAWIKERVDGVPEHRGYEESGLLRAISYMEKLDDEISRAMRQDLDGLLNADEIEEVRSKIDDGIERLYARIDKVKAAKGKGKKRKKSKASIEGNLVKEAQKATNIAGIVITIPLIISRAARVCVNGVISGGHDLEDLYVKQCKMYNFDKRERAELQQLLQDMGMPIFQDRGADPDEDFDFTSSDNSDFMANYQA